MAKKLQRVFRNRSPTPDEIAANREVRDKVEREFPPKRATQAVETDSLSELLRRSIRESDQSVEDIAKRAGVSPVVVTRFVSGERDIHMATADRLARSLGLEVSAE
jgi:ribosome-binding protein aMBF1 (putative translation factor)